MTEREELLAKIRTTCINSDSDTISSSRWEDMTIEQLRHVVLLLDEEMVQLLDATQGSKGHCFLLNSLYERVQNTPTNPYTNEALSENQVQQINQAGSMDRTLRQMMASINAEMAMASDDEEDSEEEEEVTSAEDMDAIERSRCQDQIGPREANSVLYSRVKDGCKKLVCNHHYAGEKYLDLPKRIMAETEELLAQIQRVCINSDMDTMSLSKWDELTIDQLRSVVIILDDIEVVQLLHATRGTRGHCYILNSIFEWILTKENEEMPATNPNTNTLLSDNQVQQITHAIPWETRIGIRATVLDQAENQRMEERRQEIEQNEQEAREWMLECVNEAGGENPRQSANILLRQTVKAFDDMICNFLDQPTPNHESMKMLRALREMFIGYRDAYYTEI